eukprot:TRINITY_DN13779_c0_g1_i1.p1 TRINITY_DN13779_c0_g1~~TRINITY_DN13779_c0_g1_i1.p1  ORF type:complete len:175 (-),score=35.04 TRINITY_DN13779_c0_g1_i1:7-531(-)
MSTRINNKTKRKEFEKILSELKYATEKKLSEQTMDIFSIKLERSNSRERITQEELNLGEAHFDLFHQVYSHRLDVDTVDRCRRAADSLTKSLNVMSNEPRTGFYYVRDHTKKVTLRLDNLKTTLVKDTQKIRELDSHLIDTLNTLNESTAKNTFKNIEHMLTESLITMEDILTH